MADSDRYGRSASGSRRNSRRSGGGYTGGWPNQYPNGNSTPLWQGSPAPGNGGPDSMTPRERKRKEDERQRMIAEKRKKPLHVIIWSWIFQIGLMILIAYVFIYFFGQARTNIGQAMDTTLSGGDVVLVNTLAYQLGSPSRGDIISFKPNGNTSSQSLIRRIVGMPGETVQIIDGQVYINGEVYLENANYPKITDPGTAEDPVELGDTEYFVLGDNRNNSDDSRNADIGIVDLTMIEGRAWFIIRPSSHRGFIHS